MKNNVPKIKDTVGYELLKSVFAFYVIIAVLVTLFHMYSEYSNEKDTVLSDMQNVEKIFLKQLTTSVWNFDTDLVEDIVSGILVTPSILGVSIQNNEKLILANFGIVHNSYRIKTNTLFSNDIDVSYENTTYSYSFALRNSSYNNGSPLAYITLFSSDVVIYDEVKSNFTLIIINSIIKTFALWIIFLFFANKYLTKPFFEIIEVTNEVDSKKLNKTEFFYNSSNKNEFDILKKTFNEMFERLETSYKELDISNQKNIDLNKNLELKVQDRTSELRQSNNELAQTINYLKETQSKLIESEKLASLGILVSGVAHEINTPVGIGITSVTHFIQMTDEIINKYESEHMSEEDFEEYLSKTKELAILVNTNLLKTADLVKSFKQISIEKLDENKKHVDLCTLLNKVVTKTNFVLVNKNISFNIDCEKDLEVDIYEESFSQLISNMIMNTERHAYEANESGVVDIHTFVNNNELNIIYKDYGKGISQENISKIFEPFFTTNRDKGGTGLGLNIIYNIVTRIFKGKIACKSKINEGVEFHITFPIDNI